MAQLYPIHRGESRARAQAGKRITATTRAGDPRTDTQGRGTQGGTVEHRVRPPLNLGPGGVNRARMPKTHTIVGWPIVGSRVELAGARPIRPLHKRRTRRVRAAAGSQRLRPADARIQSSTASSATEGSITLRAAPPANPVRSPEVLDHSMPKYPLPPRVTCWGCPPATGTRQISSPRSWRAE